MERTSDPATLAVKLSDAKDYLRVTHNDEDGQIRSFLQAAVDRVETDTRRSLITQTWAEKFDRWPVFPHAFFRPPLASLTSVTYTDADGNSGQTYASSNYSVDTARDPGVIHLLETADTLPTLDDEANVVTLTWVAGYGSTADDVPERLKHAIRLLVGHYYHGCDLPEAYYSLVSQMSWGSYP